LWYLIDEKRKEQKAGIKVQDEFLLEIQIEEADYDTLAELAEFETFYRQLKAKDQQKVVALLTDEQLSRQSRSRYRKYFRENFKLFFKKV
jgi:fatty acid-binding protein DegV